MKYFLRVKEITVDVRKDEVNEILRIIENMQFREEDNHAINVVRTVLESRLRLAELELKSVKESVWK